jgi:predicted secreted protein
MLLLSCMAVSVLLSLCLVASAEVSSTTWTRTYGGTRNDAPESVIQTSDGGYAVAGDTNSFGVGGYDVWLLKTDAYGNIEWSKYYGGKREDYACSVVQTSDGGYALAGHTWSFGVGECDFLLIKTDAHGNMEWKNTYGGPELDAVHQMIATSDGGYALAGYTGTTGANSLDGWFVKTDEFGKMEWNQTYKWEEFDRVYSLVETSDGGYALAGETNSFGAGFTDFWLIRTDASGNMLWNKTYGGKGFDRAYSLLATPDGGYAIAGDTDSFNEGKYDVWLIKTDANGNMEWNQTYERTPPQEFSNHIRPCSLVRTLDGGYAISAKTRTSGTSNYDFWLIKTDEQGNMEWNQTYGDEKHEQPNSLIATSDGGYVIAGYTVTKLEAEKIDMDFLVIKTFGSTEPNQYDTYEYDYLFGYFTYTIVVHSNSTIEDFSFDPYQRQISFNVTGPNQTTGFCRIVIPRVLLDGDFPVYMNGEPMTEGKDYVKTYNGTHTIIQITYSHSTHLIRITGTHTIPEFSTWTAPTILLATTLVIVIYKKKRST